MQPGPGAANPETGKLDWWMRQADMDSTNSEPM
jgi:hypothetical protein